MNMFWQRLKMTLNWIDDRPWLYIVVAIAIFVYVVWTSRANNTLAGLSGWFFVGAIIFIIGLCKVTGLSMIPFVG